MSKTGHEHQKKEYNLNRMNNADVMWNVKFKQKLQVDLGSGKVDIKTAS